VAYSMKLPPTLERAWKVKIRDRERCEPPHVTLLRGTTSWRIDLRTGRFLDREPHPDEVPLALVRLVQAQWPELVAAWDDMYPHNKVRDEDFDDDT
jgi:hypothetical protein